MDKLVKPLEAPKNHSVDIMLVVLLAGFAVKVLTYFPALFQPYSHAEVYQESMTDKFQYIAVAIPTAAESKACVLRNLIGAVSSIPKHCKCRYHVLLADEGHRLDEKELWDKYCKFLGSLLSILLSDTDGHPKQVKKGEEMFRLFMKTWVEETRTMTLAEMTLPDEQKKEILEKLCGRTTIQKVQQNSDWKCEGKKLEALMEACELLEGLIQDKKESEKGNLHHDDCADWPSLCEHVPSRLHLHYVARARPKEDRHAMRVQRVAPGTWFYSLPENASAKDWLDLRRNCHLAEVSDDPESCPKKAAYQIPLMTSRGKAGGLNFTANYVRWVSETYFSELDSTKKACLFSICDARHQYQSDFMHATIPAFFDKEKQLCADVGFAQSPQYFPEMPDALDFLDTNNAQFFRLNCMLRNCVGGVSSCGTNGTWKIDCDPSDPSQGIWQPSEGDGNGMAFCERRIFGESCKVEDTATSLDSVLKGKHSQYINRHVSYGMAKDPMDYLAAVQRWAEGGVVLSLQTYFDFAQPGWQLVWLATLLYSYVFAATIRATMFRTPDWFVIPTWVSETLMERIKGCYTYLFENVRKDWPGYYRHAYEGLLAEMTVWFLGLLAVVLFVVLVTKFQSWRQSCRICFWPNSMRMTKFQSWLQSYRICLWPNSMRMWGRLFICVDNMTYFLWCWVAFGWIAINMKAIFVKRDHDYDDGVFIYFTLILQILSWGLLISASARYAMQSSSTANEVIFLSLNNIWRGTQIFYMSAPLQLFSIVVGTWDYLRYRNFREDISYWDGGDRGAISKNIVKYWTLGILMLVAGAWIWFFTAIKTDTQMETLSSVIIATTIGLDVLHPCIYLWHSDFKKFPEAVSNVSWYQRPLSLQWWRYKVYHAICNTTVTGFFRWIGPLQHLALPAVALVLPTLGIHGAFLLVVTSKFV